MACPADSPYLSAQAATQEISARIGRVVNAIDGGCMSPIFHIFLLPRLRIQSGVQFEEARDARRSNACNDSCDLLRQNGSGVETAVTAYERAMKEGSH